MIHRSPYLIRHSPDCDHAVILHIHADRVSRGLWIMVFSCLKDININNFQFITGFRFFTPSFPIYPEK